MGEEKADEWFAERIKNDRRIKMHKRAKAGLVTAGILFLLVILTPVAYAASIGDTIEPLGNLKFALNVDYSRVFDKDLGGAISNDATTGTFSSGEIDNVNQPFVKAAVGIADNINLYGKLGGTDADFKLKESDGTRYEVDTDFGLIAGGGINASVDIYDGLRLGADVQALFWSSDVDTLKYNGESARNLKGDLNNYEFQTAVYIAKRLEPDTLGIPMGLMPYLGGLYYVYKTESDGNITFNVNSGAIVTGLDLEEDDNVGIVVGTNVYLTDNIVGNVEGRFIAETAVSAGLSYRF